MLRRDCKNIINYIEGLKCVQEISLRVLISASSRTTEVKVVN